jgi:hypothetical protein
MDEFDREDDNSIMDKLRRASIQYPANIPMLVVVSFHPDVKGLQKKQIEIQRGSSVDRRIRTIDTLFVLRLSCQCSIYCQRMVIH